MFEFYGHNCFKFETKTEILLTDPWFSNEGAFYGSWFQYPSNHHLLGKILDISRSKKKLFIFISHDHQDHLDKKTLKYFPNKTTILIPNYSDKTLLNEIRNFNFNYKILYHLKNTVISKSLTVKPIITEIGINNDSAILIKTDDFCFLNQNDCKGFDLINQIDENVTFYSVQFSGANAHPGNFNYDSNTKKIVTQKKIDNKLNNIVKSIKLLNPKYFIPAAGPPIFPFLDVSLSLGNGDNIFIHQKQLDIFLKGNNIFNNIYLRPGDKFDFSLTIPIPPPEKADIQKYKKLVNNKWDDIDYIFDIKILKNSIKKRLDNIRDIKIKNCPILVFNWGEILAIDLNKKNISNKFDYQSDYFEVKSDKKYFSLMASDNKWQDLSLSLRATYSRHPDKFNNIINLFLFSDIKNIRQAFLSTSGIKIERVIVSTKNKKYEINRFCPHQGADLCNAKIDSNDYLICPRHSWRFDLNNNGINMDSGSTINSCIIK